MSAAVLNAVRRGFYLDSVGLMRLSRSIAELPGVIEAALMMATAANKRILRNAGLLVDEGAAAAVNDLIIGVRAESIAAAQAAIEQAMRGLDAPRVARGAGRPPARTLRSALRAMPDATLALISVPGEFAVAEARKAIRSGLDVMIFSDNVRLEDEAALKQEARACGRLVMGPDCGTAIIGGHPLAFANAVPRGDIGIIGASGTGIQEVSSLIARAGRGVSQAIGVGGRDLIQQVGGISTLMAIDLLDADPDTRHIVLISKPPHPAVTQTVLARLAESAKQFTICFLGADGMALPANARAAATLRAAAENALGQHVGKCEAERAAAPRPGVIIGLYAGGTLCAEAQFILARSGRAVASNVPVPGVQTLSADGARTDRLLDLGADQFTRGRPHPMIDPAVRDDMLRQSLADPDVAVVLLDIVIGFGAHHDPAGHLASVLAAAPKRLPHLVASVTGTEGDPQVRSRQVATLRRAGVQIAASNAHAAELAVALSRA